MTIISSKATVLAIKKETTEGTLVLPTAGTDFIPPVGYPDLQPNVTKLENNELRGSIAKAKPISGIEEPTADFTLYNKHSGVEGQAPSHVELWEALFGSTSTQATERTLTSASTTTLLKLASGGSDYARGKAVLGKDSANGFFIRPIHSVATNDLTMAFPVGVAPLTGVTLGKFVNFSPANSGHPSISVVRYSGNEHSIDAVAGGKVTSMELTAAAGELITAAFSLVGSKYYFNPIEIGASDVSLDFEVGGSELTATVAMKIYKTPHELATAIQTAMNLLTTGITVVYLNASGKFKISKATGTLDLNAATGANILTGIWSAIGFAATDVTGSLTYTGGTALSFVAPYAVSFDSADPTVGKSNEVLLGDGTSSLQFCAQDIAISFANENSQVKCLGSENGIDSNFFSNREATIKITGRLDKYDADLIDKFLNNSEARFCYNSGEKTGGNWVAGKCSSWYFPNTTVNSFKVIELDGIIGCEVELKTFGDASGNGEVYLNYL